MLVVDCPEYFVKVCAFAERKGVACSRDLWEQLYYLHTYADRIPDRECPPLTFGFRAIPDAWAAHVNGRCIARLRSDWAPASFDFTIAKDGVHWFSGGLIYHGDQSGWEMSDGRSIPEGHGVDPLSVTLTKVEFWSIHT